MANLANERLPRGKTKGVCTITAILLLTLSVVAVASATPAGRASSLNLVDVSIQTSKDLQFQYTLTAYNTSGYQVGSYNGNFPEAAFGLPAGTYLITAEAYYQGNNGCTCCAYACPMIKSANGSALPIILASPYWEYGYAVEQVSGPLQVTIATKNSTSAPMVDIPVHVAFANGTAAAGAWVSANMVGTSYQYSPNWNMSGQTGPDGNFTLVVPAGPVQVSASMSVPIQLPKNLSTVTVIVGGQKVNVTVYWQPNSVSLSGQTLILPPQHGASIVLQVQQSYPYPIFYAGKGVATPGLSLPGGTVTTVTSVSTATRTNGQASSPAQAGRIAAFSPSAAQLTPPPKQDATPAPTTAFDFGAVEVLIAVVAAAAVAGVGASLALSGRKQGIESARL